MPSLRARDAAALTIVALVIALAGTIVIVSTLGAVKFGVEIFRAHVSSRQWVTTSGEIFSSSAVRGCGKGAGYYLEVKYRYTVNAVQYTSDKVWFGNGYCAGSAGAELMAARFPVGKTIDVHFNPGAPSESVLFRGSVENGTYFLFLLLLCAPIGAAYLAIKVIIDSRESLRRRESLQRGIEVEVQERMREKRIVSERGATDA